MPWIHWRELLICCLLFHQFNSILFQHKANTHTLLSSRSCVVLTVQSVFFESPASTPESSGSQIPAAQRKCPSAWFDATNGAIDRLSSDVRESPVTPRRVEFAMHEHGDVMSHKLIKRSGKFGVRANICVQKNTRRQPEISASSARKVFGVSFEK